jgi:3-oxoacyl-[acyl-carrier-protein] synthase II
MRREVVITGLGVVTAAGVGADAFWRGLTGGVSGIGPAPDDLASAGAKVVATVKGLSGATYLHNERHSRILNRTFELLVAAGALAAVDGALNVAPVPPLRLGVIVGIGPIDQYTDDLLGAVEHARVDGRVDLGRFAETGRSMHPLRRLRLLPNIGAAVLSIEHKAMGPSLTYVGGHGAGLQAIAEGLALIRDGRVDAVLCGGADSRLTGLGVRLFGQLCPLSPCADPLRACRPFDRARTGVVAGEGASLVLLEAEESARSRGADPYARLEACASAGPTEGGCAESMRRAMLHLRARPDLVVAHGDGGVQSDRLEAAALDLVSPRCITSLQPAVGHTMSACGAVNVAAACLMLADERVPPIRSLESPETALPFATHEVTGRFASVLVNAIEPDSTATSALLTSQ